MEIRIGRARAWLPVGLVMVSFLSAHAARAMDDSSEKPTGKPTGKEVAPADDKSLDPIATCYVVAELGKDQNPETPVKLKMTTSGSVDMAMLDMIEQKDKANGEKTVYPYKELDAKKIDKNTTMFAYIGTAWGKAGGASCLVNVSLNGTALPPPPKCSLTADKTEVKKDETINVTVKVEGEANHAVAETKDIDLAKPTFEVKIPSNYNVTATVEGPGGTSTCALLVTVKN